MPAISNAQMRKALTIVIEMARQQMSIPDTIIDPEIVKKRKEQLKAIELVDHLRTVMFLHHLVRDKNVDKDIEL